MPQCCVLMACRAGCAVGGGLAEGDFTEAGGATAMAELLERPERRVRGLRRLGHGCPSRDAEGRAASAEDVAVVEFHDIASVAERAHPPLTAIRQEIEAMGRPQPQPPAQPPAGRGT